MPKRKKVDSGKLIKAVKDGVAQKEIMTQFGFNNSSQLKVAYANALMETGAAPEIATPRASKAKKEVSREVIVGKPGSIIIPKGLVEELGHVQGDKFFVKKSKAGLTLSRRYR